MLDVKRLRADFDAVKKALESRGEKLNEIDKFADLDVKRRSLLAESEQLKNKRNTVSEQIARLKKEKQKRR